MSTATTPTAAEILTGVTKTVDGLVTTVEGLKKKFDEPDYSALRTDGEGRVTGYIQPTDEQFEFRSTKDPGKASVRRSYVENKAQIDLQLRAAGYKRIGPSGEFKSFGDFARQGMGNPNGSEFKAKHLKQFGSLAKAIQGMSETAGADGGFSVMPEFANGIMDRVYDNDLWGRTDNYNVGGNNMTFLAVNESSRANGSRGGGVQGYWVGEGGTITKSKPTMRRVSLYLDKLVAVVYLTDELLADTSMALEQFVTRKVAEEFNFLLGDSLINGTGVGQPLGILNAPSLVSIAKESGQLAATIQSENIVKMYSRFFMPNMGNAVWLHNQDVGTQLPLMSIAVGSSGQVTYLPPGGLSVAPYGLLQGRPLLPTEFNPTLGTQGDLMLADMGQVLSISKGGIVQAVSMHVEFLTDQMALRFTMRCTARPWENAPITPYKGTATQSNFVVLDTRA